jgi:hypothetical protein
MVEKQSDFDCTQIKYLRVKAIFGAELDGSGPELH